MQRNFLLKTAHLLKSSSIFHQLLRALPLVVLSTAVFLLAAADTHAAETLEQEIVKALAKSVNCEKIEVKIKGDEKNRAYPDKLLIKLSQTPQQCIPADYVTVQYGNPKIDRVALRKKKQLKIASHSDFKIGMLFSEQTLRHELGKAAKRLNVPFSITALKFSPPHLEVEFSIQTGSIPARDRKIVEKFIRNNRLAGYAAIRLELQGNRVIAVPDKVILNHFLVPKPVLTELKKRMNPVWQIPQVRPFDYTLRNIAVMKQYIFVGN